MATTDGLLRGVKASRRGPAISHLLFADDSIMFGQATIRGARILKDILKEYDQCSGQCVNFSKSTIFYRSNTMKREKTKVSTVLGVRCFTNLEKYLGLPNVVGRRKKEAFQNIKDKIKLKIDGWSTRLLSQGVRRFLSSQCFKQFQHKLCHVFSYQNLFVESGKIFLQNSGGKKDRIEKGYIGVSGNICADQKKKGYGVQEYVAI